MRRRWLAGGALVLLVSITCADWPQFQGPNRDGVSPETTKLAPTFGDDGPRLAWRIDRLGTGFGGPVVHSGKIYILDRVNDQRDVLRCLDLDTGKEEWTFAYDCPGKYKGNYNGSRNLPAVDDKYVFTLGPLGHVHCISKETHEPVWSRNIVTEYDAVVSDWALCQSPVLLKDTVIVAPLSDKAGVVAFDKTTGKEVWKSERIGTYSWTSPLVATVDGVDQIVVLHTREHTKLTGLDAATGKVLWTYRDWKVANAITSPIAIPDGRFFITGGYNAGCAMVKVSKAGDEWKVYEVFKNMNCGSQAQNPVFYKGFIYATSNDTKSGVMCLDLKGEVKWKTANDNPEEIGSILIADGKLLSLLSEKGILRMIEASPEGYKELAQAKVTSGANIWGPMAISNGRLLLRNKRTLLCFDVAAEK